MRSHDSSPLFFTSAYNPEVRFLVIDQLGGAVPAVQLTKLFADSL